jgi:hypothetical protein
MSFAIAPQTHEIVTIASGSFGGLMEGVVLVIGGVADEM